MNCGYIYSISCKDDTCNDIYIGATRTPSRRESQHKYNCCKGKESNRKLYRTIRNNGFWENWEFKIINTIHSNSEILLKLLEIYYIRLLDPTLNIIKY